MEAPHAAETERIGSPGPFGFKFTQRFGRLDAVPVVGNVKEPAAPGTGKRRVVNGHSRAAVRMNTALKDRVAHAARAGFGRVDGLIQFMCRSLICHHSGTTQV